MTRYKITLRGVDIELRGYVDGDANLRIIADTVDPMGLMVVASVAPDDFDPFRITDPEHAPSIEASKEVIAGVFRQSFSNESLIEMLATLHMAQAEVIRIERALREQAEAELRDRELHHFETEQLLERLQQARSNHPDLPVCEKHPDPQDFVKCGWRSAIEDIDKVLAEVPE